MHRFDASKGLFSAIRPIVHWDGGAHVYARAQMRQFPWDIGTD